MKLDKRVADKVGRKAMMIAKYAADNADSLQLNSYEREALASIIKQAKDLHLLSFSQGAFVAGLAARVREHRKSRRLH